MASFTKRNGRWMVRIRRSGLLPITNSFPTKSSALIWSRSVEFDPEKFLTEQQCDRREYYRASVSHRFALERRLLKNPQPTSRHARLPAWSPIFLAALRAHNSGFCRMFCAPREVAFSKLIRMRLTDVHHG